MTRSILLFFFLCVGCDRPNPILADCRDSDNNQYVLHKRYSYGDILYDLEGYEIKYSPEKLRCKER